MLQLKKDTLRTINLIKKSADHPKITIILLLHLSVLLKKERLSINFVTDSLLRLILMAASTFISKQFTKTFSNDKKLLEYLRNNKNHKSDRNIMFKVKLIIIYLINRPYSQLNNFISFELINSYMDQPMLYPYISQYFLRNILANCNNVPFHKPISKNYLELLIDKAISHQYSDIANQKEETQQNITKAINLLIFASCCDLSEKEPETGKRKKMIPNQEEHVIGEKVQKREFLSFQGVILDRSDMNTLFILECLTLFAKTHKNTDLIKRTIPNDENIISMIKLYLNDNLNISNDQNVEMNGIHVKKSQNVNYDDLKSEHDHFIQLLRNEITRRRKNTKFITQIRNLLDEIEHNEH
ncbi:hypothetical protein M153_1390006955 [Pseudoloma neurophilia]|uniref:Uncharacterized protein n=1 Tax=Pseudoloma neurophilia TaxID=146866 RepID=A0A0R0LZN4_9MICR|nr:hypothetical protein M153_1390006955 [Pseudoloma neurophilia]